jgi:2-methylcitrate dehydratase PrpD
MADAIAEQVAQWAVDIKTAELPDQVRDQARRSFTDVTGLCLAARHTDYVKAAIRGWGGAGACTVIGHGREMDAAGATFVNGAVAVPAVLAACQANGRGGDDLIRGIAVAAELMCRMALVQPTGQHKAGFHPTAVIGAMAAAGVGAALGMKAVQIKDSLGIAGSFASGIIEYLAEGAWTKRLHPGWAAQSGIRAAMLGREGFLGPRTVFEGTHGFYFAFGDAAIEPVYANLTDGLGVRWKMAHLAFKPYACGTMCQPYIDAARNLAAAGIDPSQIAEATCNVGEGIVDRLCEPATEKARPSTPLFGQVQPPLLRCRRPVGRCRRPDAIYRRAHARPGSSESGRQGEIPDRSR